MVRTLFAMVKTWINTFPPKGGNINIYSPRLIIVRKKLDWKKDCHIKFGQYYQVKEYPHHLNDVNTKRITGAVAPNSKNNDQGGYFFMSLTTGNIILRHAWQEVPILSYVIKWVEKSTKEKDKNLTFTNRHGNTINDNDALE